MSSSENSPKYPPVIETEFGPVTEVARAQAELNIARDPDLRRRMIEQFGEAKVRAQYPRAFENDPEDK
jgi:hypothetical protein